MVTSGTAEEQLLVRFPGLAKSINVCSIDGKTIGSYYLNYILKQLAKCANTLDALLF